MDSTLWERVEVVTAQAPAAIGGSYFERYLTEELLLMDLDDVLWNA
ncbi:MAG: hypothetical protein H6742_14760 [Alphaproteobacteria bacterium]|nr:hypothetical protein [Alphaproteobacteria bacterium]